MIYIKNYVIIAYIIKIKLLIAFELNNYFYNNKN